MDQIYQYIYYLLTESEVTTGNSDRGLVYVDQARARSIHQGRGLRFPCNDKKDDVNKFRWSFQYGPEPAIN